MSENRKPFNILRNKMSPAARQRAEMKARLLSEELMIKRPVRFESIDSLYGYGCIFDAENRRIAEVWNGNGPAIVKALNASCGCEPCSYDPEPLKNVPIGMHHCPQCGEMVLAGYKHPDHTMDCPMFDVEYWKYFYKKSAEDNGCEWIVDTDGQEWCSNKRAEKAEDVLWKIKIMMKTVKPAADWTELEREIAHLVSKWARESIRRKDE